MSSRIVALTAGAALAVGAQALLPLTATAAAASPVTHGRHAPAIHPPHRARAARGTAWVTGDSGGRGLRLVHGGPAADAIGKIFFSLGDTDYVCSGALVRGRRADVVLTAAHCVRNGRGQWATDWTFVPGYNDGADPYGQYNARRFFVSPRWTGPATGNERYDVAFVQVTPVTAGPRAARVGAPRGLPIRFSAGPAAAPGRDYVFGYPALAPFTGLYANYCAGRAVASAARPGSVRTPCAMTAGDSGGPWLSDFSPRTGTGVITAVTAYKLSGNMRMLYGAVLGPVARALYLRAST